MSTGRAGFTLLEALVALAITALVLAALAGSVTATLRARDAATARADGVATARTVLLHLERELASSLPEGFTVTPPPHPALRFVGGEGGDEDVTYTLDGDAIVRRTAPRFAPEGAAPADVPLVRGVSRFDVRVLAGGEGWVTRWQGKDPPAGVAVDTVVDGEPLGLVVAIPTGRLRQP